MTQSWQHMGNASDNAMGVEIFGLFMGLGFVLSFGYWCTNYLVVQRAMAARDMTDARNTPIVGAFPKMFIPFVVIVPGIAAAALATMNVGYALPLKNGGPDYDKVLFSLMSQFYPSGMLGVGLTALVASFMSGMAGNVTAFNTVWTYDIYQSYIKKDAPDAHYLWMGRMATVFGTVISIGAAYLAMSFNNMMDYLQLIFGFINAPLFATFLLGMFWKRSTGHAAFSGLVTGTSAAAATYGLTIAEGKGGFLGVVHEFPSSMAQNFWGGHRRLCGLPGGDCRGQLPDQAAAGIGAGRAGLWRHQARSGNRGLVSPSRHGGDSGRRGLPGAELRLLLKDSLCSTSENRPATFSACWACCSRQRV